MIFICCQRFNINALSSQLLLMTMLKNLFALNKIVGVPERLSQLNVQLLILAQVMISESGDQAFQQAGSMKPT